MASAGCYTLDLYCDETSSSHEHNEFPHVYIHQLGSVCRSLARRDGWIIGRSRDICPKCSKKTEAGFS